MKTQCLIDPKNNNITIQLGYEAKRLIIDFAAAGKEDEQVDFGDIHFGYQLQVGDSEILEESWPIEGVRFGKLSPGVITSADIPLNIDTNYKLLVWYTKGIYRHSDVVLFNSGKPFKGYESMVWNKDIEEWEMLKPYPEEKGFVYIWNEEDLEWQKAGDLTEPS
jgi:hypothetical protein